MYRMNCETVFTIFYEKFQDHGTNIKIHNYITCVSCKYNEYDEAAATSFYFCCLHGCAANCDMCMYLQLLNHIWVQLHALIAIPERN